MPIGTSVHIFTFTGKYVAIYKIVSTEHIRRKETLLQETVVLRDVLSICNILSLLLSPILK